MSLRHREHRVALIPLDDRPVNIKLVRMLAEMVDYEVSVPPPEIVGHFDQPGDPEALTQWLTSVTPNVDSILISLDMLVYGGHVASMQPHVRPETALGRLEFLEELRTTAGDRSIYVFGTIPPPEGMPLLGQDVGESRAVARHAELRAQVERQTEPEPAVLEELGHLRADVSPDYLSRYHEMRRRNLTVNLRAVELAANGTVDFLMVGQESPRPFGPHITERDEILARIASRGASGSAVLTDGYSEGLAVLFARFVHAHMATSPVIATVCAFPTCDGPIHAGETETIRDAVRTQILGIGASEVDDPADADICLYVNPPTTPALDDSGPGAAAFQERKHQLHQFAIDLSGWVASDRLAGLADAAIPGAADEALMHALHDVKVDLTRLGGFAARETLGATVGTVLSHVCMRRIALQDKGAFDLAQAVGDLRPMRYLELLDSLIASERAHIQTLFARFVEDYLYQTRIKNRAGAYVADLAANSPISLTQIADSAEDYVRTTLSRAAGEFYMEHFLGRQAVAIGRGEHESGLMLCELGEARVRLPWRRLAEVDVDLDFGIQLAAVSPE